MKERGVSVSIRQCGVKGGGGGGGGVNMQHTSLPKKKQNYTYFDPLLGCVMFT